MVRKNPKGDSLTLPRLATSSFKQATLLATPSSAVGPTGRYGES